jgi:hypothetical protein
MFRKIVFAGLTAAALFRADLVKADEPTSTGSKGQPVKKRPDGDRYTFRVPTSQPPNNILGQSQRRFDIPYSAYAKQAAGPQGGFKFTPASPLIDKVPTGHPGMAWLYGKPLPKVPE